MPHVHCGDQDKIQNSDFGQLRRNTAPEIIGAGFIHLHRYDVAGGQSFCSLVNKQVAVDFGGVGLGAAGGDALGVQLINDHIHALAQFGREFSLGNGLCLLHKPAPALLLDIFGYMIGQVVGARAGDVLILKTANPVELRLIHPIEQGLKLCFSLAGIADDES